MDIIESDSEEGCDMVPAIQLEPNLSHQLNNLTSSSVTICDNMQSASMHIQPKCQEIKGSTPRNVTSSEEEESSRDNDSIFGPKDEDIPDELKTNMSDL